MFELTPLSSVFLTIGPIKFHYYGLMYVFAFLFAYLLLPYLFKIRNIVIKKQEFEDIFFAGILGAVLGGRVFYILFYNLNYYLSNPLKSFAVWEGGMASHGGFIGAAIAIYIICKNKHLSFLSIIDVMIIPVGIGLMFGRFGNLVNGELFGRVSNVPWCINFDAADGCRHPSQVYAMLKDLILFTIMFFLRSTKWKPGILALLFINLYSLFRFILEFFSEPDFNIGYLAFNLSQGQYISIVLFLISIFGIAFINKNKVDL